MSAPDDSPFPDLDLWLFEEPAEARQGDNRQGDRAHRLHRLQLTVAELEANAAEASSRGDQARADDLLRLADELRAKHAKWDRRATRPPKWRYLLRRYVFNRRRGPR